MRKLIVRLCVWIIAKVSLKSVTVLDQLSPEALVSAGSEMVKRGMMKPTDILYLESNPNQLTKKKKKFVGFISDTEQLWVHDITEIDFKSVSIAHKIMEFVSTADWKELVPPPTPNREKVDVTKLELYVLGHSPPLKDGTVNITGASKMPRKKPLKGSKAKEQGLVATQNKANHMQAKALPEVASK